MNIAVVGKWAQNLWGAEHSVQRGFWALGHEVVTVNLIHERRHDGIRYGQNWPGDADDYVYDPVVWNKAARTIRDVDLTVVMQGYGMLPETIAHIQAQTRRPVVLWHGEVLGDHWPTDDEVVQGKMAALMENLQAYDLVLHNCRTSLDMLKAMGATHVAWCPVNGVDPRLHQRLDGTKRCDVGVYGWASLRRVGLVQEVCNHLGPEVTVAWPDAQFDAVYGPMLVHYINACTVILNVHFSQTLNTECRLYESLGCGTAIVSEPLSMPDLFPDGWGVRYGETPAQLAEQIKDILAMDTGAYAGFADQGYAFVHQRYRYEDRCAQLLETVAKELPSCRI